MPIRTAKYCFYSTRADEFLKADLSNNFLESTRLKGLMDGTKRRFKVVLCGLHNVLRNTERANHPLAHFGAPICVGPLRGNGDQKQARALIKEPLAAAGYTFEKDSLATHHIGVDELLPVVHTTLRRSVVEAFA